MAALDDDGQQQLDDMSASSSSVQRMKQEARPDAVATDGKAPNPDPRPPAKRSRKAINCEPCRASKLKCDRARPCSSCVLRGTASACYQDARGEDTRGDDHPRIDPHHEIARIRQALATLEAHIIRGPSAVPAHRPEPIPIPPLTTAKPEPPEPDASSEKSLPGVFTRQGTGALYAGPTSYATQLVNIRTGNDSRDTDESSDRPHDDLSRPGLAAESIPETQRPYDDDLLERLPALHIIDGLVDYYFEYCNWIYRHVNHAAFLPAWQRFKTGQSSDRLVLATVCVIMGIAIHYLPARHALAASLAHNSEELCVQYYGVAREALARHRAETRALTLELVELLLVRTHYLTLMKNETEEIWSICGELVSVATAIGLHRDPDKWRMARELAERRRWAWWHIILLERWQCFLFGRPLLIASHHFDTRMPTYVDPSIDPTGRIYLPNLHLFRLAYILGGIVDDAVAIRPAGYERITEHDRELVDWLAQLPKELDLDEYRLARSLSSPIPATMRFGVQSYIIRNSYYHIRFTLHRPYAAAAHDSSASASGSVSKGTTTPSNEHNMQSLDIAVGAADKLIQLVGQSRPDLLSSSLDVPGHTHWGPFHCFSAAMFFCFQLIANPKQPGANMFRGNIRRTREILAQARGTPVADKAMNILLALEPLCEPAPPSERREDRELKRKEVLGLVKTLAFPYHDSPAHLQSTSYDSPDASSGRRALDSPGHVATNGNGMPNVSVGAMAQSPPGPGGVVTSPLDMVSHNAAIMGDQSIQSPVSGIPPGTSIQSGGQMYPTQPPPPQHRHSQPQVPSMNGQMGHHSSSVPPPPMSHPHAHQHAMPPHSGSLPSTSSGVYAHPHTVPSQQQQGYAPQQGYADASGAGMRQQSYTSPDDVAMWGASVPFGQGEWTRFLDSMQRQ